jgi:hypothetical protein
MEEPSSLFVESQLSYPLVLGGIKAISAVNWASTVLDSWL